MKLQRKSTKLKGTYDVYSINRILIDHSLQTIEAVIALIVMEESGVPIVTIKWYQLNNPIEKRLILDPAWSSSSTPSKPENFDLNDISTWGDITYDMIPLIEDEKTKLYTLSLPFFDKLTVEDAVLTILTNQGMLPLDNSEDGWNLV